jgi:hypothetical protein
MICSTDGCTTVLKSSSLETGKCFRCRVGSKATNPQMTSRRGGTYGLVKVTVPCMNDGDGHVHKAMQVDVSHETFSSGRLPRKICYNCLVRSSGEDIESGSLLRRQPC